MDPTTTGAAGVAAGMKAGAGWKLIGGTAGVFGLGAAVSTLVVMLMSRPQSQREWGVALISTVMGSFGAGSYAIMKLGILKEAASAPGDITMFFLCCQMVGIIFACGLPGWLLVRSWFNFAEKRRQADIAEIAAELKKDFM